MRCFFFKDHSAKVFCAFMIALAVVLVVNACQYIHAVVNAIAHIDIKPPWLTKQGFVAGGTAAVAVAGEEGLVEVLELLGGRDVYGSGFVEEC
jgi:hypothetical protein